MASMDDTTLPPGREPTNPPEPDTEMTSRIDELEAADPADAPALAEPLADDLARDLDRIGSTGAGEDEAGTR